MTVSIGIPFFNPGPAFEKAVRSVFAQSFTDWELLLVDDGSTDGSLELASRIADPRVRVLSDGRNRGLCARLNQIASESRHELLCRMDADDVMHPERLRRQVGAMAAAPTVDVIGALAIAIDADNHLGGLLGRATDRSPTSADALRFAPFVHPSVMGRRRWFLENPYDEAFVRAEDQELWCRAAPHSTFRVIAEPLLFYRQPSRINVPSYVASCRTVRRILSRYGPGLVGRAGTAVLLTKSWGKQLGHQLAHLLRLDRPLLRLWASHRESSDDRALGAALSRATTAPVPGWPPPPTSRRGP